MVLKMSTEENNYCLYAVFDNKYYKDALINCMQKVQSRFSEYLAYPVTEEPHITIMYGPSIKSDENELVPNSLYDVSELYGDVFGKHSHCNTVQYVGVSHFDNGDNIVVKSEYKSDKLNDIRDYIYMHVPSLFKRRFMSYCDSFDNIDDLSCNIPSIRWAHSTIAVFARNKSRDIADVILKAEEMARNLLDSQPVNEIPTRTRFITAHTNTAYNY